jgi:hypothetical protein
LAGLGALYNAYKPEEAVAEVADVTGPMITEALPDLSDYSYDIGEGLGMSEAGGFSDYIPEPVKQIGSGLLDFGGSLYDDAVDFISGIFT